jgi:aminoglycoside 3-N-acetyltransferase
MDGIKSFLRKIRYRLREGEIRKTSTEITKARLIDDLRGIGVSDGDAILLHSSLKNIGYVKGGPGTFIDALLDVLTPSGTLVVPTYQMVNYNMLDTCRDENYIFDPRTAGTYLGYIPATFLSYPGIERSIHPTHSVSALGKDAKYITEAHHLAPSTFGTDSPWDRLIKLNGRVLGVGVTLAPVGIFHMLEDMLLDRFPVPARMSQTYKVKCRDYDGKNIEVPVTPHDPEVAITRIDKNEYLATYFGNSYYRAGILKTGMIGDALSYLVDAGDFYEHLEALLNEGITIYSTPDVLRHHPIPDALPSPGFKA